MNGKIYFNKLTESDKYWLAGYLEGEGSFMSGAPSDPNNPIVSFCTTDEDVANKTSLLLGSKYYKHREERNKLRGWKTVFQSRIVGGKAYNLMIILKPLMGERRQKQIEKAMSCYKIQKPRLETEDLLKIRELLKDINLSKAEIGRIMGVSRETISKISLRKSHYNN